MAFNPIYSQDNNWYANSQETYDFAKARHPALFTAQSPDIPFQAAMTLAGDTISASDSLYYGKSEQYKPNPAAWVGNQRVNGVPLYLDAQGNATDNKAEAATESPSGGRVWPRITTPDNQFDSQFSDSFLNGTFIPSGIQMAFKWFTIAVIISPDSFGDRSGASTSSGTSTISQKRQIQSIQYEDIQISYHAEREGSTTSNRSNSSASSGSTVPIGAYTFPYMRGTDALRVYLKYSRTSAVVVRV